VRPLESLPVVLTAKGAGGGRPDGNRRFCWHCRAGCGCGKPSGSSWGCCSRSHRAAAERNPPAFKIDPLRRAAWRTNDAASARCGLLDRQFGAGGGGRAWGVAAREFSARFKEKWHREGCLGGGRAAKPGHGGERGATGASGDPCGPASIAGPGRRVTPWWRGRSRAGWCWKNQRPSSNACWPALPGCRPDRQLVDELLAERRLQAQQEGN